MVEIRGLNGKAREYSLDGQANHDQHKFSVSYSKKGKSEKGGREMKQRDGKRKQTGGRTVVKIKK